MRIQVHLAVNCRILRDYVQQQLSHVPEAVLSNGHVEAPVDGQDSVPAEPALDLYVTEGCACSRSELERLQMFKRLSSRARTLVIGPRVSPTVLKVYARYGVRSYVNKDSADNDLGLAFQAIQEGKDFVSPCLLDGAGVDGHAPARCRSRRPRLSNREKEVLFLLTDGLSNREIGAHLGLSVRTIEVHRERIRKKLGLKSTAELVRYALKKRISSL